MDAFWAAFIFGSFWWYIVTGGFFIWAIVLTEKESVVWVVFSLFFYLVFLSTLGKIYVFSYLLREPLKSFLWIIGYFAVGVIWSFIKWWLKVTEAADKYKEEKEKFFKEFEANTKAFRKSDCVIKQWQSHIEYKNELHKPIASHNKKRISVWIIYWPFSFIWSLLHDIVRRIFEQFVIRFQKFYQGISDRAYKKVELEVFDPMEAYKKDDEKEEK